MSFAAPRHARTTADEPMPTGERRSFLNELDAAVRRHGGMSCGVVPREGSPVLLVINAEVPRRSVEVSADFVDRCWWFTWAESGATIGTVDDVDGVADVVGRAVGVQRWVRP
ncbi:hypothetical protein [Actinomadura rubrisoli]|uniref:Uncharacterized protein n=1 Tax=Actinomadura rubrisoli TaxID=2530368 RepID=A0A4R5BEZ9_9ACTN|nr:hypothetical protein [Actinomadura rubrisoli]TDD83949.1 hypothetical protein E1298_20620 [Actinomadura rubrisoli]